VWTRYAGIDHWKATRDATSLGGDGPVWKNARTASPAPEPNDHYRGYFCKGAMAANQPIFMPGLNEAYEKKP